MRLIPLWEADEERAYDLQKSRPQRERLCQRRLWAEPAGVFRICSVAQKKFPGP